MCVTSQAKGVRVESEEMEMGPEDSAIILKSDQTMVVLLSTVDSEMGKTTADLVDMLGNAMRDPDFVSYLIMNYSDEEEEQGEHIWH